MKSILKTVAGLAVGAVLALGVAGCSSEANSHVHTFAEEWTSDATHHWHAATCEHTTVVKGKAEHNFGEWTVVTAATEDAEGKKTRKCDDCEYVAEETIAKLDHVHVKGTHHDATTGNCVTKATVEYYDCAKSTCAAKLGVDGNPLDTIYGELNPSNHVNMTDWTSNNDATKNADGTKSRSCTDCEYKETVTDEGSKLPKEVGDFILKDGTVLAKSSTPESGTVAAVIVRAAANGKPALGVGFMRSDIIKWCEKTAAGYDNIITALVGTATSGYMDGSDGWEKLKAACSDAAAHPEYYPAWNYCRTYAATNGLTGDLANGWYLPTMAELYTIAQNKATVDESLLKAGATSSQMTATNYWSCNPHVNLANQILLSASQDGAERMTIKDSKSGIARAVRAFN